MISLSRKDDDEVASLYKRFSTHYFFVCACMHVPGFMYACTWLHVCACMASRLYTCECVCVYQIPCTNLRVCESIRVPIFMYA